jgi:parvulin-like peptidyl-prolyl isomerase
MRESPLHAGDPRLQPPQNSNPDQLPGDTVILEVHGLCAPAGDGAPTKSGACTTKMTKDQFNAMLSGIGITNQITSVAAMRSLAESWVQMMAMAAAAQQEGIDKDARFGELMKIVRTRTLAEAYRHLLEEKLSNPSQEKIQAYYNENKSKFEEVRLDRIFIPKVSPKLLPAQQADFNKKAAKVAFDIRERAVNGEDMSKLQNEASHTLDVVAPANIDIGARRRGTMAPAIEKDIWALKGGEVTKVELEPSGYNIYRLRSRDTLSLEQAKQEIIRELHRRDMEVAMKNVNENIRAELNEQFFKPQLPPNAPKSPATLVPLNPPGSNMNPNTPGAAKPPAPAATTAAAPATGTAPSPK